MSIRKYISIVIIFILFDNVQSQDLASQHKNTIVPPIHITAKEIHHPSLTSGPKATISKQQIAKTGASSLTEALQGAGHIQVLETTGNGSQAQLSLRGFGGNASSNSLLLIDGMPITNPDMAPPDLNTIPLYSVESIEITAGSESVLYGDQAVGGVVNLLTNNNDIPVFNLACSLGSYNTQQCYTHLQNHYKQMQYDLNLSHKSTDNYREQNNYEQNVVAGFIRFQNDSNQVKFNFQLSNESMQYPGALTLQQVMEDRRQANNDTDFFKDQQDFLHLNYMLWLNDNWHLISDLSHRGMNGNGVLFSPFTQNRDSYFIKPQLHGTLKKFKIRTGVDAQFDQYKLASSFGTTNASDQKYSLFALANYTLSEKVSLSFGARGAQQSSGLTTTTENNTLNRAFASTYGLTYDYSPTVTMYLRRAESYRFPKVDENAASVNFTGLRTQRGVAYEGGIKWNEEHSTSKIEIYQLNLRDEIAFDPLQTPSEPFGTNRNLSPTTRCGGTFAVDLKLASKFTMGSELDYVRARYQNGIYANNRIPLVSEAIANLHATYAIKEYLSFYMEALFTGNQYAANDDANTAGTLAGYTIYNANLRYQYKQFTATFRVNNIFNKLYNFYTVYQTSMQTKFFYPAPERNFLLTLNYNFL